MLHHAQVFIQELHLWGGGGGGGGGGGSHGSRGCKATVMGRVLVCGARSQKNAWVQKAIADIWEEQKTRRLDV